MKKRLQRYLSNVGFCSKRHADKLIRAGKILVDGKTAKIGDEVSGKEDIVVDGERLLITESPEKKIVVFYKPKGVVCSLLQDNEGPSLLDFDFGVDRVFPIGRLDIDSHGLLLLTNDGVLGNKMARPGVDHKEEYLVTVRGEISAEKLAELADGVILGRKKTAPCRVENVEENILRIILHDGRSKQIRKMCEMVGFQVKDLKRVRIGSILLEDLQEGKWRALSDSDYQKLNQKLKRKKR